MSKVGAVFFFSSRRRHTRCGRDWSSDVCSSDLGGKPLRLTTTDQVWGSPDDGLAVASKSATTLELTAKTGYTGPASAVFEVTDGTSLSDPRGQKALIAVPVQIGRASC